MDWFMWVVLPTLLSQIHGVSLNPFAGFADQQYEPAADYSIHRGVYLPNMPTTSIFPLMSEDSINGMVGIPALQSPFVNPLLQQQSSHYTVPKQAVPPHSKNTRPNHHHSGNIREQQRNNQQKPRGVTLDIRGGGYRLEQPSSQRPYKPPATNENPVRNNVRRPPSGVRNASPSTNRKQIQRPRGPTINSPHYKMKYEAQRPSIPPNVEFVNPENVLPFHPRIYKQFLQQNPEAVAQLRGQKRPPSGYSQSSKPYDANKRGPPNPNRNRNARPTSQASSSNPFANGPSNFQTSTSQQSGTQLSYGLQGQSPLTQTRQPTFEDIYNSDPQFYAAFAQTPEGKQVLSQMYQHFGPNANKQSLNSPNKVPTNVVPKSNLFAQTYADINSYTASTGHSPGSVLSNQNINQYSNNFGMPEQSNSNFNKPNVQEYALRSQYNQRPPQQTIKPQQVPQQPVLQQPIQQQQQIHHQHQPNVQQQSNLNHQQQPNLNHQQQPNLNHQQQPYQGPSHSSVPSNQQISSYSGRPTYEETVPSPGPSPESKTQYPSSQDANNQYNPYAGTGYAGEQSFANIGTGYDPSTYQSPYQENPKVVDSLTIDHSAYVSNFSPVDPLTSTENANNPASSYYGYSSGDASSYGSGSSRYPSTALHEISPSEIVQRPAETSETHHKSQPSKIVNAPGYWTPEQLFAPQSTGLQKESPFSYPKTISTNQQRTQDEQQDGSERAALHLAEEAATWSVAKPQESSAGEYSVASELDADEGKDNPVSTEQAESNLSEDESDEEFKSTMRGIQKLWTRVPQKSAADYRLLQQQQQRKGITRASSVIYRSTEPPPTFKTTSDDLKNHRTTPSYTFQYSPSDKSTSKSTAAWWSRKTDGTRYKIPPPQPSTMTTTTTTPSTTITTTTEMPTTTTIVTTETPEPTFNVYTTTPAPVPTTTFSPTITTSSYLDSDDTPLCARHNNLTYCLQDPEYPKEAIREAIERNRHPLDHFLVDISAASNMVDDQSLHSVFENSAPLQSTSVSYSFEGKVISPSAGEMLNTTGCNSNVHYAKPLRALNTAGQWKVIVNVEFEDTGANYTQTVRIEECTHQPGFVATCGTHSISACLQQYKLYRLLSWEAYRGFYIDAFLLPVACFCGSQDA